jgi:hypothetical protein
MTNMSVADKNIKDNHYKKKFHGIRAIRLTTIHKFFFFFSFSMEAINSSTGVVVPSHSGFMSIKLDRTNYPLWLAQIVPILKSKNLMGFVTGTNPCPPESLYIGRGKSNAQVKGVLYKTMYWA